MVSTLDENMFSSQLTWMCYRFLDLLHTAMICLANWSYLIVNFGDRTISDFVFWCAASFS